MNDGVIYLIYGIFSMTQKLKIKKKVIQDTSDIQMAF